ncbi:hypothetical protein N9Y18_06320 [Litoricolaceae bacterium]|nr:hypothetical protein [Litorivicinaceae bacterium]
MSLGLLATPTVTICKAAKMVFNVAPGNFYLSQYLEYQKANGTSATVEALAGLAGGTDAAFITTVLTNLGLADDAGAQSFLETTIAASGRGAALEAAITALNNVAADDATYGAAKTSFDSAIVTSVSYSTNIANNTTDTTALAAAIDAEAVAPTSGTSYALSDKADNIQGAGLNDTITGSNGTVDTLAASDIINGGGGDDLLRLTLDTGGTALPAASYESVEQLEIRDTVGATIDLDLIESVTNVVLKNSTAATTLQNVDTRHTNLTLDNIKGDVTVSTGNVETLNVTAGSIAGDATKGDDVDFDITEATTAITTVNVTTTGDARFELMNADETKTITVAADGGSFTVDDLKEANALTTLTVSGSNDVKFSDLSDAAALKTVTSTTSGTLDLDYGTALATTVETITVTGDGAVKATLGANTSSLVGGSGNDFVDIDNLVFSSSGSIAAGEGSDTISIAAATSSVFSTAAKANISGFEILDVTGSTGGDTVKFTQMAGFTSLTMGANTNVTVTNLTDNAPVTMSGSQTTDVEFGITNATDAGSANTLNLTIDSAGGAITVAKLGAEGTETLSLTGVEDSDGDTITISAFETGTDFGTITYAGEADVIFSTTAAATVLDKIDGSTATGKLTVTAVAATKNLAITGGSNNDDLNGSALLTAADVLNGGAGDDRLTGAGGGDKYTGGTGKDTFEVDTVNGSNAATLNTITDFESGGNADQIEISIADFNAIDATPADLVDGNTATIATGSLTVKEITKDTTVAAGDEVFVLVGDTFADTDAVEDALETGAFEITLAAAPTAKDMILVLYSDGTDAYLASAVTGGTNANFAAADLTVTNHVKLVGNAEIATGEYATANFELLA